MSLSKNKKTRICYCCKKEKPLEDFYRDKNKTLGRKRICKECKKNESKLYRKKNKDKLLEYEKSFDRQYSRYKRGAKKRGYNFLLIKKEAKENFYNTNCSYCGDIFDGLGIDRVDNSVGYVFENCVPCCPSCNLMKHAFDKSFFLEHCKKISVHNFGEV